MNAFEEIISFYDHEQKEATVFKLFARNFSPSIALIALIQVKVVLI